MAIPLHLHPSIEYHTFVRATYPQANKQLSGYDKLKSGRPYRRQRTVCGLWGNLLTTGLGSADLFAGEKLVASTSHSDQKLRAGRVRFDPGSKAAH